MLAFHYFGMAMHTVMDIQSPAHQWAVYRLTGVLETDVAAALLHNQIESRLPNRHEMRAMTTQMDAAMKYVFSDATYRRLRYWRN